MTLPVVKAKLLDGRRGLIVGIANDRSIAWGCARAFRALGAELSITYLSDKAKPHVEPLAREVVEDGLVLERGVRVECRREGLSELDQLVGPGLDEVEEVAVALLCFVPRCPVVGAERGLDVGEEARVLLLEKGELALHELNEAVRHSPMLAKP